MDEQRQTKMSKRSKDELVKRIHPRYLQANKAEKGRILDEFVVNTGCHRKHAIRLLGKGIEPCRRERRGRQRTYSGESVRVLVQVWRIAGRICGKRLQPFLPELVAALERHGELTLAVETREQLLQMSASTIDRKVAAFRPERGRSTTKPGTLLKSTIPIRTFADWDDARPGFVEVDLVAHCGDSVEGQFIQTLTAVDVRTGWTECLVVPCRNQGTVSAAIQQLRQRLPFPLLGIDSDNDGAFINETLNRYCQAEQITFTRSRPYRKNDQAHVEQKNWTVVRQTVGYRRYESVEALALLQAIYVDLRLYVNFFQPVMMLKSKSRSGSKVRKKYDSAQTPHQRAVASEQLSAKTKLLLNHTFLQLNPVKLRADMDANLHRLWQLPR
jgi:hypothetical protein